mmetsp:Transcript_66781/g.178092  ORF Transcript_66781/g.178092 Transcript_66781/m.178092 type:complete len:838 (+) Transcript_66781:32-2545(+)
MRAITRSRRLPWAWIWDGLGKVSWPGGRGTLRCMSRLRSQWDAEVEEEAVEISPGVLHKKELKKRIQVSEGIKDYLRKQGLGACTTRKQRRDEWLRMTQHAYAPEFANQMKPRMNLWTAATEETQMPLPRLPEIAIVGRSNCGKSTIVNQLSGRYSAKLGSMPGSTQDVVFWKIGNPPVLCMVDLPGYGFAYAKEAARTQWQEFMLWYLKTRKNLRRVLVVVDARFGLKDSDRALLSYLGRYRVRWQIVVSKCDRVEFKQLAKQLTILREEAATFSYMAAPPVPISAQKRVGLDVLRRMLSEFALPKAVVKEGIKEARGDLLEEAMKRRAAKRRAKIDQEKQQKLQVARDEEESRSAVDEFVERWGMAEGAEEKTQVGMRKATLDGEEYDFERGDRLFAAVLDRFRNKVAADALEQAARGGSPTGDADLEEFQPRGDLAGDAARTSDHAVPSLPSWDAALAALNNPRELDSDPEGQEDRGLDLPSRDIAGKWSHFERPVEADRIFPEDAEAESSSTDTDTDTEDELPTSSSRHKEFTQFDEAFVEAEVGRTPKAAHGAGHKRSADSGAKPSLLDLMPQSATQPTIRGVAGEVDTMYTEDSFSAIADIRAGVRRHRGPEQLKAAPVTGDSMRTQHFSNELERIYEMKWQNELHDHEPTKPLEVDKIYGEKYRRVRAPKTRVLGYVGLHGVVDKNNLDRLTGWLKPKGKRTRQNIMEQRTFDVARSVRAPKVAKRPEIETWGQVYSQWTKWAKRMKKSGKGQFLMDAESPKKVDVIAASEKDLSFKNQRKLAAKREAAVAASEELEQEPTSDDVMKQVADRGRARGPSRRKPLHLRGGG